MQLAAECAAAPLEHTEVDLLITSCEESGMLGAQAYARRHEQRAAETTFLNFDTVGGPAPLTYILREGSATMNRPASPRLVGMLESIAQRRPDLGLVPARTTPGLPTDATPMRARGWEAVTLLAQGETIPNYHWPTDTYENVDPPTVRTGTRYRPRAAARARRRGLASAPLRRYFTAMSQSDIDNIRARYEAANRGDRSALFRDVQPDFALKPPDQAPGAGTYVGSAEAARFMEDLWEPFEEVIAEPQDFLENGDRIVALLTVRARHKGSSAFVEIHVATLWTMRDGKPVRMEMYPQPEKALEAAGLASTGERRPPG